MPTSPLKLCSHPGCNARIESTRRHCAPHEAAAARAREARRGPREQNGERMSGGGNAPDWRALRKEVLTRDPTCKTCKRQPSKHADHIVPKRDGGADVASNLQGVCHSCHSRKTASQDGGFGNARRIAKNRTKVLDDGTIVEL